MKRRCYVATAPGRYAAVAAPSFDGLVESVLGSEFFASPKPPAADLPMSVWQDAAAYFVEVDVPGVKLDDVSITVHDRELTVAYARPEAAREGARDNRRFGQFEQKLSLPDTVNADAVEAKLAHGVLSVRIPKVEQPKPRKVAVTVEG